MVVAAEEFRQTSSGHVGARKTSVLALAVIAVLALLGLGVLLASYLGK
jgi:hypothetical protein